MAPSFCLVRATPSRTCAAVGVRPAPPAGRSSGGGVVRGGSATVTGVVGVGAGVAAAAAGVDGADEGGRAAGIGAGPTGVAGVSGITAGTGSIATRGGGSGISSGTATDDRAGFDAQAPASNAMATRTSCLVRIS